MQAQGGGRACTVRHRVDLLSSLPTKFTEPGQIAALEARALAVTGYIAFDVPSAHGMIVYAPNSDGQPIAEWSY